MPLQMIDIHYPAPLPLLKTFDDGNKQIYSKYLLIRYLQCKEWILSLYKNVQTLLMPGREREKRKRERERERERK